MIESKSGKTSVLDTFCVCLSVDGGLGCGWGLEAPAHLQATGVAVFLAFLVADTQLYKRLCPPVRPLVSLLVRHGHRVEKWGNERFRYFLCMFECGWWFGVWMGVGCPCPPVRNDIVTPRHFFFK